MLSAATVTLASVIRLPSQSVGSFLRIQFGNGAIAGRKETQRNSPEVLQGATKTTSKRVDRTVAQQKAISEKFATIGTEAGTLSHQTTMCLQAATL